jgi:hypothetical protein
MPLFGVLPGTEYETEIAAWLRDEYECKVFAWGQEQLPLWVRRTLQKQNYGLRYEPDLLVGRGTRLWGVDVKSGGGDYSYYVLNQDTYYAQVALQEAYGFPFVTMWHDRQCTYLSDLALEDMTAMNSAVRGNGRPYFLVPKRFGVHADEVFG